MTPSERAVRDAVKGGYNKYRNYEFQHVRHIPSRNLVDLVDAHDGGTSSTCVAYEELLLDPAFWKAIGVTRGYYPKEITLGENWDMTIWLEKWHSFIDYLANGKTIDDALKSIEV